MFRSGSEDPMARHQQVRLRNIRSIRHFYAPDFRSQRRQQPAQRSISHFAKSDNNVCLERIHAATPSRKPVIRSTAASSMCHRASGSASTGIPAVASARVCAGSVQANPSSTRVSQISTASAATAFVLSSTRWARSRKARGAIEDFRICLAMVRAGASVFKAISGPSRDAASA